MVTKSPFDCRKAFLSPLAWRSELTSSPPYMPIFVIIWYQQLMKLLLGVATCRSWGKFKLWGDGGWLKRVNRQLRKHWNYQDETGLIIYPRGSFGPPGGGGGGLTVVAREVTSAHRQLLYDRHHTKGNTSRWNERNTVSSNERNTVGKVIQIKLMQMIQSKAVQHIKLSYIRNKLYTDNWGSFQANTNQIGQYGIGIWNNLTMFDFENKQLLMLFTERKDKGAYERDCPPKYSIA